MMSKIIQKEKERQELFLQFRTPLTTIACQKHSLINLKEYLEGEFKWLCDYFGCEEDARIKRMMDKKLDKMQEDIAELNLMIERYK